MNKRIPFIILLFILLAKALFFVVFIDFGFIHLGPDEAQYWTWSRSLDFGYYSKPPGIAWQIFLGCLAFGQTELGVRIGSVVLSALISLAMYRFALSCNLSQKYAAWAGAVMALIPLGMLSSLFAITDVGMVLFWILALTVCIKDDEPNDYLLGAVIALGAIFKWPIYFFWLLRLLWGWLHGKMFSAKLFAGIGVSLLGLIPSVYWNSQHSWVTFKHVFYTLFPDRVAPSDHPGVGSGNLLEFIGSQAGLFSPVFFVIVVISLKMLFRDKSKVPEKIWFCGFSSVALFGLACVLASFQRMQGNWTEFAYPGLIIWMVWYISGLKYSSGWLFGGTGVAAVLCVLVLFIPVLQSKNVVPSVGIPYKINPFRHNLGWSELSPALKNAGYESGKDFVFSDKYQTSSLLSFYGPDQHRAYFLNLQGMRLNQFSFWPGMAEEQVGKTGFFVLADNIPKNLGSIEIKAAEYINLLKPYFESVVMKGPYPLFKAYDVTVKEAWIFECKNYNGREPPPSNKF